MTRFGRSRAVLGAAIAVLSLAAVACGKGSAVQKGEGSGIPRVLDGGAHGAGVVVDGSLDGCGYTGPHLSPADYDACPSCANARCVLAGLVLEKDRALLGDCADGVSKCVPDAYLEPMGNVLLPTCQSLQGREGRCVSICLPGVAAQLDRLPRDVCGDDERCSPCYDPITGEDTGACRIGCDKGPSAPPVVFSRCCHDLGACVPMQNVAVDERGLVLADTCLGAGELCAPEELLNPDGFAAQRCDSIGGGEGRCLPDCVALAQGQAGTLPKSSCPDHYLCAPCFDPIAGAPTGACAISNDPGPTEPRFVFPGCCDDQARCVPRSLLADALESSLDAADCADDAALCVPNELALDASASPASCMSWNGAEGRCLPSCLPLVAKDSASLTRGSCAGGLLCAPCYDPVSGDDTGACALGGDPGPSGTPYTFPECCGGLARCLPKALVANEQRVLLGRDSCSEAASLCVPKALVDDAQFLPERCVASVGDAEGRCLLSCLPDVSAAAFRMERDGCASDELCATCFDPFTGEETGACHVGGDEGPSESAYVFPECCGGLSACVPKSLVADALEAVLVQGGCSGSATLCVPKPLAQDAEYVAPSCVSWNGSEGRCLPACLPLVAKDAPNLTQGACLAGHLCAPCFDPLDGSATFACDVGGDPGPVDDAYTFPLCCGGASQCLPRGLVEDDQEGMLSRATCADANSLCVPKSLAADSESVPTTCTSWGGAEGRCLLSCLPEVAKNAANLVQGSCQPGELCSPCYDPVTGTEGGSCHFGGDPGPTQPAYTFPECCGGASRCIPKALVDDNQEAMLAQGGCADSGSLCVPKPLAADAGFVPATCASWNDAEGRCLPSCLPSVAANAANLEQGSCQPGELCSPCYDPLTGEDNGSCHVGGDAGPTQAPYTFATCCSDGGSGTLGTCVPSALVPSGEQLLLGKDTCAGVGDLCEPTELASDSYTPQTCTSYRNAEGRCLPQCMPTVAASAGNLRKDVCGTGELCMPCFDQLTGASTGACSLGTDAPASGTAVEFPSCCPTPSPSGALRGTCVPAQVAGASPPQYPTLTCETQTGDADTYLCKANEKAESPSKSFAACTTAFAGPSCGFFDFTCSSARSTVSGNVAGKSGACVPSCMISEKSWTVQNYGTHALDALYGQSTPCISGEDCVPCNYPTGHPQAGQSTGLCY